MIFCWDIGIRISLTWCRRSLRSRRSSQWKLPNNLRTKFKTRSKRSSRLLNITRLLPPM